MTIISGISVKFDTWFHVHGSLQNLVHEASLSLYFRQDRLRLGISERKNTGYF